MLIYDFGNALGVAGHICGVRFVGWDAQFKCRKNLCCIISHEYYENADDDVKISDFCTVNLYINLYIIIKIVIFTGFPWSLLSWCRL